MTQKDIKELVNVGAVIDITTANEEKIDDIKRKESGLARVASSYGVYGMNGALYKGYNSGRLYAVTARNTNIFSI